MEYNIGFNMKTVDINKDDPIWKVILDSLKLTFDEKQLKEVEQMLKFTPNELHELSKTDVTILNKAINVINGISSLLIANAVKVLIGSANIKDRTKTDTEVISFNVLHVVADSIVQEMKAIKSKSYKE